MLIGNPTIYHTARIPSHAAITQPNIPPTITHRATIPRIPDKSQCQGIIINICGIPTGTCLLYTSSEITAAEDVYIAYGTQFQHTSIGISNEMSPFTKAICDEILEPNIDVDELFTRVRRTVYSKYQVQIPASVNALLNKIILHKQLNYTNFDEEVYKFVKKYADDYNNKYGYFHGEMCIRDRGNKTRLP